MRRVVDIVERSRARGEAVALGTVVSVSRSAPCPPGAVMAVTASGEVAGMVSGGCVEASVVDAAEEVMAGGEPRLLHFGIADEEAWAVGLPCGGEIDVWVSAPPSAAFVELVRAGGRGALVTRLDGGGSLFLDADGHREGGLGDPALDRAASEVAGELMWSERSQRTVLRGDREQEADVFIDVSHPPPRLLIFGAVEIAVELCRLARQMGWRPYVIDPRRRFAGPERFPGAEEVIAAWPAEAVGRLGGLDRATSVVVLTHDPKIDDEALGIALRSEAGYVGAMGSRRAQEARSERLRALGLSDSERERLAAPIGLDLGAVTPEETALSIMGEIVALRRGREGGRLRHARGRIHEVGA